MFAKASSLRIDAPPEAVFDYVADIGRHPEWAHEKMDIEPASGSEHGPGAKFKRVVHFMGAVPGEITVVEDQRPSKLVYDCADKASAYRWTFDVRPDGPGTRLTHSFVRVRERGSGSCPSRAWSIA